MYILFMMGSRFLVGSIFIFAGVLKLKAGFRWFNRIILSYNLIQGKLAVVLAIVLPIGEVICGIMLFTGLCLSSIVPLSFGLLFTFNFVLSWSLLTGRVVEDCGCFGRYPLNPSHQKKNIMRWSIICRNEVLMGLLVSIAYSSRYVPSLDNRFHFQFLSSASCFISPIILFTIWVITIFLLLVVRFGVSTKRKQLLTRNSIDINQ